MTKAFILNLDTGSDTDFLAVAEEISAVLTKDGMAVISCVPWASPKTVTPGLVPLTPKLDIPPEQPL